MKVIALPITLSYAEWNGTRHSSMSARSVKGAADGLTKFSGSLLLRKGERGFCLLKGIAEGTYRVQFQARGSR